MKEDVRRQVPDFVPERLLNGVINQLEKDGFVIIEWDISKNSLIAAMNYIRKNGFKCEWIENGKQKYSVKISKPSHTPPAR